jgi:pimeloyl-ACP methyl ester carboxylesterase
MVERSGVRRVHDAGFRVFARVEGVMSGFGLPLLSRTSEVRYTAAGDAHAAYRVITGTPGDEYDVVLLLSGTMSMEALFDDPVCLRLIDGLADLGRLVVFDRCGIGLSDPPTDVADRGFEGWYRDLEAVIAASQLSRPVLVAASFSAAVAVLYCDRRPEEVDRLVLYEPYTPSAFGFDDWSRELIRSQLEGTADSVALFTPSRATEPGFRDWFSRAGQFGASPRRAERAYPTPDGDEVEAIDRAAARVRAPMLVLRRPAHEFSPDRASHPFMALVPAATRVDLPGEDLLMYGGEVDALLAEVAAFVTGEHRPPAPERIVAAVLYSDLVASTDRNTAVGDTR